MSDELRVTEDVHASEAAPPATGEREWTTVRCATKIALDLTYVAYYGDRDEMKWVQGAPEDKGYT